MEFKKLDIKSDENWFKRTIWTSHGKKTLIYTLLGAVVGFVLYFVSDDKQFSSMTLNDVFPNIAMGALFGFFITNSPCARNQC